MNPRDPIHEDDFRRGTTSLATPWSDLSFTAVTGLPVRF